MKLQQEGELEVVTGDWCLDGGGGGSGGDLRGGRGAFAAAQLLATPTEHGGVL